MKEEERRRWRSGKSRRGEDGEEEVEEGIRWTSGR